MNERTIGVNGADLWVAEQGVGLPLVLCTGGPGLYDYLGPVAVLVDGLAQIYRFDPRLAVADPRRRRRTINTHTAY